MSTPDQILAQTAEMALKNVDTARLYGRSVLVTGSTGLIGRNIVAALEAAHQTDISKPGRALPPIGKWDFIIHAAGYAQPARFLADPMGTAAVNTTVLMELIGRLNPGGRLLFLSTSEVYSGHPRSQHREEDVGTTSPLHPRAIYIDSKRCGEAICYAAREKGIGVTVARVSSVYGPGCRAKDTRVMSEFIQQAITQECVTLKDGGVQRRVFLYVSDAVEMLLNILLRGENAVYNVGGWVQGNGVGNVSADISIHLLARKIGEAMKVPVKTPRNTNAGAEGAPAHVGLDISRYNREFGEKKFVPFDEGLQRTIAWHLATSGARAREVA